ncbi:lipid phosphate phosphatase 2-like [Tripterygium wilfordii]|uniref:lipid phosphate phosphatase 2-like n=1 Tax=Tripterygium wilfordii TaxID=458696 RepID=UPI0018F85E80|nr:lipid phosphate phosphatase 2-like [Tripterygium wilfordii]
MADILLGSRSVKSHGLKVARIHMHDWLILLLLLAIVGILNFIESFHRFVGEEMMIDLKYPFKHNTIPVWSVPIFTILLPIAIFFLYYYYRLDVYDWHHAILGILYSVLITGVITDAIKDVVGRPRPNFFWRCFPDGNGVFDEITGNVACYGDPEIIKEGYKSFPSGHTSWSFAGLTFLSWYIAGKIRAFDRRGHVAKLCIVLLPILGAALVGVSHIDDYWHHWTDVFAGALIGTTVAALCYLQFFPFPNHVDGWAPHAYFKMLAEMNGDVQSATARINSLRVRRPDATSDTTAYVGCEIDRGNPKFISQDTSPV